jgi:hypothetical protein
MDSSEYALNVFDSHIKRVELEGQLSGKVILELGPGDCISTSIISYAYGAQSILVDSGDFMKRDVATYKELAGVLAKKKFKVPEITSGMNFKNILETTHSQYFTDGLKSLRSIPSNSVDFIFSQAVLEH